MNHTLTRIANNSSDYVACNNLVDGDDVMTCNRINWYENAECVECGESLADDGSIQLTDGRMQELCYDIAEGYPEQQFNNWDLIELSV